MKLHKIALLAALLPSAAFAQSQPSQDTPQPSQDTPPPSTDNPQPSQATPNKTDQDTNSDMSSSTPFGLTVKALPQDLQSTYGGPKDAGIFVSKVESGSPADRAGVKVGDVITKIDGMPLANTDDLTKAWKQDQGKKHASIEIVRDHQTKTLQANMDQKGNMQDPGMQQNPPAPKE